MLERRHEPGFALEALHEVRGLRDLRRQHFDGHAPLESRIERRVDDSHAAASDLAFHLEVAAEEGPNSLEEGVIRRGKVDAGAAMRAKRNAGGYDIAAVGTPALKKLSRVRHTYMVITVHAIRQADERSLILLSRPPRARLGDPFGGRGRFNRIVRSR